MNAFEQLSAQNSSQQYILGQVTDTKTGLPLELANVFIAKSTMGSTTDKNGNFYIQDVPSGTFEIVVSMMGYEIIKKKVIVPFQSQERIHFKLIMKPIELPEVAVTARDLRKRQRDLDIFTKNLLSTTWNAYQTRILNPEVLIFSGSKSISFSPRVLKARATEPLLIENRGLGYQITYVLEYFEITGKHTRFAGIPMFDKLEPKFEDEPIDWENNRRIAYEGSLRHFLRAICETYHVTEGNLDDRTYKMNTTDIFDGKVTVDYKDRRRLEQEGFYVLGIDNPFWEFLPPVRNLVNTNQFLIKTDQPSEMYLKFPEYLEITYNKEVEDQNYLRFIEEDRPGKKQTSWLKLESDSVLIDIEGRYFETFKLHYYGYWAWERLADMLPYEYTLDCLEEKH